jgi:hypothetical protein
MFCDACGAPLGEGQVYCSKCGKAIVGVAQPDRGRVARHRQLLGILWIAYSTVILFVGIGISIFFHHFIPAMLRYQPPQQHQGPPPEVVFGMLHPIINIVVLLVFVKAVLGIVAGIGVLARAGWGRVLAMVVACVSLLSFPIGTAVGVYTLWVLLAPGAEAEFGDA